MVAFNILNSTLVKGFSSFKKEFLFCTLLEEIKYSSFQLPVSQKRSSCWCVVVQPTNSYRRGALLSLRHCPSTLDRGTGEGTAYCRTTSSQPARGSTCTQYKVWEDRLLINNLGIIPLIRLIFLHFGKNKVKFPFSTLLQNGYFTSSQWWAI